MLFAAVSVIWGVPYLFIKIAVDELSPSVVAWSRLAIAAVVLLPLAWRLGALRGLAARWRTLTVFAAVEMAIPWQLLGFGELRVSSSLTAILIAAVPLFVALLALRFDHAERPTPTRLAGMLIGLAWPRWSASTSAGRATRCSARRRSCSSPSSTRSGR
jgi:drug/metabolite transporter (DMT)-like permease